MTSPKKRATSKPKAGVSMSENLKSGVSASEAKESKPKAAPVKHLRVDVYKCSACGQDHTRVLFSLRHGWERMKYPYAAKCPISGKEILLKESD